MRTHAWRWLAIATVLIVSHGSANAKGFKGIYLGQPAAELPQTLTKSAVMHQGIHDSDFFIVTAIRGVVTHFSIIYSGESVDRSLISKSMSLAQALRAHSFAATQEPKFALARGNSREVWGLVDISNAISYQTTRPTSPDSRVMRVGYLGPNAPVLRPQAEDILGDSQTQMFRAASAASDPDQAAVVVVPATKRFSYETRESARAALTEQVDLVIGRGKRTLTLIEKTEVWLGVNENHPEAKETFRLLRQFHRDYLSESDTLLRLYQSNSDKLAEKDRVGIKGAMNLEAVIKRKMTQLRGMGFVE